MSTTKRPTDVVHIRLGRRPNDEILKQIREQAAYLKVSFDASPETQLPPDRGADTQNR